ncbi:hypothetical protein O6H91_01G019500 [Diphasiastrum complanatum]|uniref:Uncharacterized protein n=1 Tax=Diphasiastrum complanatum TaxID=34168 RepID=A0ACC2ENS4_DIPCM|nr:hypothetical protein O6H91_01G019500 [Diphasiastrum complanatum]
MRLPWRLSMLDSPFERVPVVFGGDFRQILPVVPRGNRAQIVNASLKCSRLWKHMEVHKLTKNMPVMGVEGGDKDEQLRFADYLLSVGDGREPTFMHHDLDLISLQEGMCVRTRDVGELISFTFHDVARHFKDVEFLRSRAILTPLNKYVDEINARVVEQLPGDIFTFYSAGN